MALDRRSMDRREFSRIKDSELKFRHISMPEFSGYAGLLSHIVTDGQWNVIGVNGSEVTIADNGYTWLQLSPDAGGWWLTVMYDTLGNITQYYFDITLGNALDADGVPGFVDLYLDIVMDADGSWKLLDRNELDAALQNGAVSEKVYGTALQRAQALIADIDGREGHWRTLCSKCMSMLSEAMP